MSEDVTMEKLYEMQLATNEQLFDIRLGIEKMKMKTIFISTVVSVIVSVLSTLGIKAALKLFDITI